MHGNKLLNLIGSVCCFQPYSLTLLCPHLNWNVTGFLTLNLPDLSGLPDFIKEAYTRFSYSIQRWNPVTGRWEQTQFTGNGLSAADFPRTIQVPRGYYVISWTGSDANGVAGISTSLYQNIGFTGQIPLEPSIGGGSWVYFTSGNDYNFRIQGITQDILNRYNQILINWRGSGGSGSTSFSLNEIDQLVTLPSELADGNYDVTFQFSNTATGTTTLPSATFSVSVGQVMVPSGRATSVGSYTEQIAMLCFTHNT